MLALKARATTPGRWGHFVGSLSSSFTPCCSARGQLGVLRDYKDQQMDWGGGRGQWAFNPTTRETVRQIWSTDQASLVYIANSKTTKMRSCFKTAPPPFPQTGTKTQQEQLGKPNSCGGEGYLRGWWGL